MATRGELAERILRIIYDGTPSNDAAIDIREVGLHINSALAFLAKANFYENYKFEGVAYVNDGFISTFKDVVVSTDTDVDLKYITLPENPVGLPKNRGIVEISKMKDKSTTPVVMVPSNKRSVYQGLNPIKNRIIGWQEGGKVFFDGSVSGFSKALVKLIAPASNDMDENLNIPKDAEEQIIEMIVKRLMLQRQVGQDKTMDGVDSLNK